jgi:hypothetical protein
MEGDVLCAVQRNPHNKCTQNFRGGLAHDHKYGGLYTMITHPKSGATFIRRSRQPHTTLQMVGRTFTPCELYSVHGWGSTSPWCYHQYNKLHTLGLTTVHIESAEWL